MSGQCECEEGLPEWIMSYADMITILMAFFVVMYSMAGSRDEEKEEAVMKSLRDQFGPMMPGVASLGPGLLVNLNSPLAKLSTSGDARKATKGKRGAFARQSRGEHPRVHTLKPGEQVAVGGVIYFPEDSAEIRPEQRRQLQIAADELGGKPQKIEIRGHTSFRPAPHGEAYRDNWDLAYSRCRGAMQQLVALGIDRRRIRLGVAADNEPPLATSDVAEKAPSSRVEIFMLNEVVAEPGETSAVMPSTEAHPGQEKTKPKAQEKHHG